MTLPIKECIFDIGNMINLNIEFIEININKLIENKISPSEYCILSLLYHRQYSKLKEIFVSKIINFDLLLVLEANHFVKLIEPFEFIWSEIIKKPDISDSTFESINLRSKAFALFEINSDYLKFLDLWNRYPIKVNSEKGIRTLRPANPESNEGKECYEKWKRIIGSHPERADKMIKALERQLIEERGNLAYFRQFIVWLNKRVYERYISDTEIKINETKAI